jgi:hypothetical protein
MSWANLDIKDAHNQKNKKTKENEDPVKTIRDSQQNTTSGDDTNNPNKALQNDAFKKVTVHKHHRRPV